MEELTRRLSAEFQQMYNFTPNERKEYFIGFLLRKIESLEKKLKEVVVDSQQK